MNLIEWKIRWKHRLPVDRIHFCRRGLKKRNRSEEDLGNFLSIEATIIIRNVTGEAMNYRRIADKQAGFFLELDLLLR